MVEDARGTAGGQPGSTTAAVQLLLAMPLCWPDCGIQLRLGAGGRRRGRRQAGRVVTGGGGGKATTMVATVAAAPS